MAGGYYVSPGVYAESGDWEAQRGMYRMQVYDERTTGMHGKHRSMARSISAGACGESGGAYTGSGGDRADPATALAGMLPIPPDLDEMMFAGFLRRDSVEMVACETNDLEVPANAEIVLEGYVNLNEMRTEGPFGDHTGFIRWKGSFRFSMWSA